MKARDLVYGREKLRALWRVLLFLAIAAAAAFAIGAPASLLAPPERGGYWEIFFPHAVLSVALAVASAAMMHWAERRPFAALGLPLGTETWQGLLKGAAVGSGLIALVVVSQTVIGWLRPAPDSGTVLGWLETVSGLAFLFFIAAAAEELLFRGYPFQVLVESLGAAPAVVISSALFAWVHSGNPEVGYLALLNIGLAGVIMALAYLRTRSLWTAIGLHWAWNWVMAAIFDLPVSGVFFDVPGYDTLELGPNELTGGAFGPEGGLVITLLALPLIVWLARTSWLGEARVISGTEAGDIRTVDGGD